VKKKLDQYNGLLTPQQVATGMNLAEENAQRLQRDAALLLELGRKASAMALAILSIEESGKLHILRRLAAAPNPKFARQAWRLYRSHTAKNVQWSMLNFVPPDGKAKLRDFRPMVQPDSDLPHVLDQIKQLALYTDCLGEANWTSPSDLDETLAEPLVMLADILSKHEREYTAREVELWIEHVGDEAIACEDFSVGGAALVKWYAAMQTEGLIPSGPNLMEQFTTVGLQLARRDN
jgi:AbiV family abortive infection protein